MEAGGKVHIGAKRREVAGHIVSHMLSWGASRR